MKVILYVRLQFAVWIILMFLFVWTVSCGRRSQTQHEQSVTDELPVLQKIPDGWESLMDGKTLAGWEMIPYGGETEPYALNGTFVLPVASDMYMTGIRWVGDSLPVNNYEIYYEARRMEGHDFFGSLSFPFDDTFATLIIGGWGGSVCGISCIDGQDASNNETTKLIHFKEKQWYAVHLRVTADSIRATIDSVQVTNMATSGKRIHLRSGTEAESISLFTYLTTGEIRNLCVKRL